MTYPLLYILCVIAFAVALAYAITRLKEWQFAREARLKKTGHGFEVLPPSEKKLTAPPDSRSPTL